MFRAIKLRLDNTTVTPSVSLSRFYRSLEITRFLTTPLCPTQHKKELNQQQQQQTLMAKIVPSPATTVERPVTSASSSSSSPKTATKSKVQQHQDNSHGGKQQQPLPLSPPTIPPTTIHATTMKAAIRTGTFGFKYGWTDEMNVPTIEHSNQVLVRVLSAGIHHTDYRRPRVGVFASSESTPVYGIDFCGTIVSMSTTDPSDDPAAPSSKFTIGDIVFGKATTGSLAEYAIAEINQISKVPSTSSLLSLSAVPNEADMASSLSLSIHEAASIPLAYTTAIAAFRKGGIATPDTENSSKTVLVVGATESLGLAALHVAKAMKVGRIIAICKWQNADFAYSNGATDIVPYITKEALTLMGEIDFVYDVRSFDGSLGSNENYIDLGLDALKETGTYITLNAPIHRMAKSIIIRKGSGGTTLNNKTKKRHRWHKINTDYSTEDLETALGMLQDIGLKPEVQTFPFGVRGCQAAYDELQKHTTLGHIAIDFTWLIKTLPNHTKRASLLNPYKMNQ